MCSLANMTQRSLPAITHVLPESRTCWTRMKRSKNSPDKVGAESNARLRITSPKRFLIDAESSAARRLLLQLLATMRAFVGAGDLPHNAVFFFQSLVEAHHPTMMPVSGMCKVIAHKCLHV